MSIIDFSFRSNQHQKVVRKNPLPEREKEIGRRLREIRELRMVPRTALARRIGMSSEAIADYENGRNALPLQQGEAICRILKVNQRWLLTGELPRDYYHPTMEVDRQSLEKFKRFSEAYDSIIKTDWGTMLDRVQGILAAAERGKNPPPPLDPALIEVELQEEQYWLELIERFKTKLTFAPPEKRRAFFSFLATKTSQLNEEFQEWYERHRHDF